MSAQKLWFPFLSFALCLVAAYDTDKYGSPGEATYGEIREMVTENLEEIVGSFLAGMTPRKLHIFKSNWSNFCARLQNFYINQSCIRKICIAPFCINMLMQ